MASNIEYEKTNCHSNVNFQRVKVLQVKQILHHPLAHRNLESHTFVRSGEMRKYEEGEVKHEFDKLDQLL
jgi:hypothetical protein